MDFDELHIRQVTHSKCYKAAQGLTFDKHVNSFFFRDIGMKPFEAWIWVNVVIQIFN